jgi:hypothetical protein
MKKDSPVRGCPYNVFLFKERVGSDTQPIFRILEKEGVY